MKQAIIKIINFSVFIFSISIVLSISLTGYASQPGWQIVTAPQLVSPTEARTILEKKDVKEITLPSKKENILLMSMGDGLTTSETQATPQIVELARALQHDPKLIFNYVKNHIDYVPSFGSVNGATATLLAGRGNDFDQASLLIALMRTSGFTADYVSGDVTYPISDLAAWLGTDSTPGVIAQVFANGGIPVSYGSNSVTLMRVWVQVNINGTNYVFDPAFRKNNYETGINLASAMGYNKTTLLSAASAGATIGTDYIQNLNESNIRSTLQNYSNNLINYIRSNKPNSEIREIIGGPKGIYEELETYSTTLPYQTNIANQTVFSTISDNYRLKIRVQHQGIDRTFSSFEIAGKRVTIFFTGTSNAPQLKVEGELVATGNATAIGTMYDLIVTANHPYASSGGTYCDQTETFHLKSGGAYALACDFENVSNELMQERNKTLTENKVTGTPESEAVLGESLNIMAMTWLNECNLAEKMMGELAGVIPVRQHKIGVMAQEEGYYIDVKMGYVTPSSEHGNSSEVFQWFFAIGGFSSAFEHGILQQLQGIDKIGASTVKLLQLSNANNKKSFYASSSNFSTITPQLQNYQTSKIAEIQGLVNAGFKFILPQDANIALNEWTGMGYIQYYHSGNSGSAGMIISGDYNGGYSSISEPVNVNEVYYQTSLSVANISTQAHLSTPTSIDPVDMLSGSFLSSNTDISLGASGTMGLGLTRSYNSSSNSKEGVLGRGWSHNYDVFLETHSDGNPGLGTRTPIDSASAIVSLYIANDLMETQDSLINWLVATQIQKWMIDQLIENVVTVHMGSKTLDFVKLADGSYSSPPNTTVKLVEGTTFRLEDRFDLNINFNTDKKISSIVDADNNSLTFQYSGDKLQSVRDTFQRSLTLTYNGDLLDTVTDSTGRSVSYDYTNGNLTGFRDLENKLWQYGYDSKNRITTLTNPLNIITVTNTYDELDRVKTQTVPRKINGSIVNRTYNLYFSGYMNIEEDTEGNQTIYYFDDKGRTVSVENALGNRSYTEYDGQNHVVKTTDPRGNEAEFTYDGNHNLVKAVGPLSGIEYDTGYTYDAEFRLTDTYLSQNDVIQRNLSHLEYDTEHHLEKTTTYPEAGKEIFRDITYYSNGLTNTTSDGKGIITTLTYDSFGNPDTSKVDIEPLVDYVYNSRGWMTDLNDQAGSHTGFTYNNRGQILTKIDPLSKVTGYTYYDDGSLHSITDRKNNTISYSYTPSGKMDTITYQDLSTVGFQYDSRDNLYRMQDSIGTTTYNEYDAASRLRRFTDAQGFEIAYNYDNAGNLTTLTYPGNKTVTYTYDELNRLETVTINWVTGTPASTFYYDASGRLDQIDQFNGTKVYYGYDNADRLTDLENEKGDTTPIATYHFTLDNNGNRTHITKNEPLSFDPSAQTINYTYNTQKNRLLTAGADTFTHDDEGQLSAKNSTSYTFDYEHRLKTIGSTIQYFYNGMGNRVRAVRNGVTTKYIYDARGNLLAEADVNNVIQRYYIYGNGLRAMVTAGGQLYCYHYNATGNTIAITDSSQNIVNKYAYTPFGEIGNEQETFAQPFKYVGQYGVMSESNGLYYMRARYYDPTLGRFISEDPAGFRGGDVNLYVYVGNNPVLLIDPSGLCSQSFFQKFETNYNSTLNGLYGEDLEWADSLGLWGASALAVEIGMSSVQSLTDALATEQIANGKIAGSFVQGDLFSKLQAADIGANTAARTTALRTGMRVTGAVTGVITAGATGYSLGARLNAAAIALYQSF
jgi:RHS repeat-associated protein